MLANRISQGDVIGLICPSHIAGDDYRKIIKELKHLGFQVRLGANIYKNSHGYLASEKERADDLNQMVDDKEVKMVLFGGGWGANEILPLIDYENIKANPKIFSSYSDGTSILDAIYTKTGLITYYGLGAGHFHDLPQRAYMQFAAHFLKGNSAGALKGNGEWKTARPGMCEGVLIGGYALNFGWLLGGDHFPYDPHKKYLLFLEDHENYHSVAAVSAILSHIEQSPFIHSVAGLLFGHYADTIHEDLLDRLARFGERHNVPVVYSDDFGHFASHTILPIGVAAQLNSEEQELKFLNY